MEEFENDLALEIAGGAYVLRYWAMNYGTHVGSTLRLVDQANDARAIDLSFECHWNAPGRYILRQGSAIAHADYAFAPAALLGAGLCVMRTLAGHFAAANSLADVYARIGAATPAMLEESARAIQVSAAHSKAAG